MKSLNLFPHKKPFKLTGGKALLRWELAAKSPAVKAPGPAPVLDPTLYQQGAKNLNQIKRLAAAAHHFQKEIRTLAEE